MWLDWVFPNCLHCSVSSGERKGTISSKSIPTPKVSLKHNIQTVFSIPSSQGRVWDNTFACNSLTIFEYDIRPFTGNGNSERYLKIFVKTHYIFGRSVDPISTRIFRPCEGPVTYFLFSVICISF